MTQLLEPAPVKQHVDTAVDTVIGGDIDRDLRRLQAERGYQSAVESTYWYMLAMLLLGLFGAFWIVVMART